MKKTTFKISTRRTLVGPLCALIACALPLSASAQEAPLPQERGPAAADAQLHALVVEYPNPYRVMETAEVKAVMDRVLGYLEGSTPAALIHNVTREPIDNVGKADPDAILKPGDFRLNSYEWGVTYAGMLAAGAATGDRRYTDYTVKRHQLMADLARTYLPVVQADLARSRAPIKRLLAPHALDDAGAMCMSFMMAKNMGSNVDYGQLIDICGKYVTETEYRLPDGTLARGGKDASGKIDMRPLPNTLWLDDMYMGIPTIALMGKYTGKTKYYDDAVKQVVQFSKRMFNPRLGLYMHGYVEGLRDHPELRWARANGWAIMAMIEVLEVLPKTHPGYQAVEDQLRKHAAGLANLQHRDGMWHQLLDRPDSYLESSATAIFAYAFARGVNRGYLDKEMYGTKANLAWNAVAGKINTKGEMADICVGTGMAFDPAFYHYRPTNTRAAHGYGPLLLAGAEIIELNRKYRFGLNDSGFMYQGTRTSP